LLSKEGPTPDWAIAGGSLLYRRFRFFEFPFPGAFDPVDGGGGEVWVSSPISGDVLGLAGGTFVFGLGMVRFLSWRFDLDCEAF